MRKPVFGVSDPIGQNRAVQPQKMAGGLKFRKLICVLVFAYAKKPFFSRHGSYDCSIQRLCFVYRKNENEKMITHMQSVLPQITQKAAIRELPSEWLFYEESTRASRLACVRTCTLVTPITIALFAGPTKLPADALKEEDLAVTLGM